MPEAAIMDAPEVNSAPVVPVTPAPEKLTAETFHRDTDKSTPDVLSALSPKWSPPDIVKRGQPKAVVQEAPKPVTAPADVTPAPAPVVEVKTPAPEATPAPSLPEGVEPVDPNSPDHPKNWKMKAADAKEALFFQLRKSGVPINEAYAEVYGEVKAPQAVEPISEPEPSVDLVKTADQQITSLAAQSAELEAKIDEVAESDPKTALKLTRQQADIKLQLSNAQREREAIVREAQDREVSTAVEKHRALENKSLEAVREAYPELADKTSEKRAQFNLKVAELEKDPSYGANFRNQIPGWPLLVARMVDAEKGWSRTPAPGAVTPAPKIMNQPTPAANPLAPKVVESTPAAPTRATSAELLSSSSNPGAAAPVLTPEQFWRDTNDIHPDTLLAMASKIPVDPRLTKSQKNDPRRFGSP